MVYPKRRHRKTMASLDEVLQSDQKSPSYFLLLSFSKKRSQTKTSVTLSIGLIYNLFPYRHH